MVIIYFCKSSVGMSLESYDMRVTGYFHNARSSAPSPPRARTVFEYCIATRGEPQSLTRPPNQGLGRRGNLRQSLISRKEGSLETLGYTTSAHLGRRSDQLPK